MATFYIDTWPHKYSRMATYIMTHGHIYIDAWPQVEPIGNSPPPESGLPSEIPGLVSSSILQLVCGTV